MADVFPGGAYRQLFAERVGLGTKRRLPEKTGGSEVNTHTHDTHGNQCFYWGWESHPSTSGPGVLVCTGGSAATASTPAAEGAGEGAAGSLELLLLGSDPLSLENFT